MNTGTGWGDLLAEAQSRLEGLDSGAGGGLLGEAVVLGEYEHFQGRWRGEGTMQTRDGARNVYLVWHTDGSPAFLYQHARLAAEIDEVLPSVGDTIVVLRGQDVTWETRDGEQRTVFAYSVVSRPCDDPLPGTGEATASGGSFDDDVLFAP